MASGSTPTRSAVWAWLGWLVPIVSFWVPKQIVDDSWRITSSSAAVGQRGRYRDTSLWWGLWIAYLVAGKLAGNSIAAGGKSWALAMSTRASFPLWRSG